MRPGKGQDCKGKFVAVHAMKACRGSRGIAPLILSLGTRYRWVVNFTPRPLFRRERTSLPFEWEAVWAPEPVWRFSKRETLLPLSGFRTLDLPARRLAIYQLRCPGSKCQGQELFSSFHTPVNLLFFPSLTFFYPTVVDTES
jgi:hypothetical protein